MKTSLLVPTLAFALAVTAPACAQTIGNAQSNQGHPDNSQDQNHDQNVLTIRKLKQDLEQAGFSDVKILEDSFVVQARDKNGNPTIMSLSPSGVVAISELSQQTRTSAANGASGGNEQSTTTSRQTGRTARAGTSNQTGTASGPAEGTNVKPSTGIGSGGEAGRPGLPGNKNGPAVMPPNQR